MEEIKNTLLDDIVGASDATRTAHKRAMDAICDSTSAGQQMVVPSLSCVLANTRQNANEHFADIMLRIGGTQGYVASTKAPVSRGQLLKAGEAAHYSTFAPLNPLQFVPGAAAADVIVAVAVSDNQPSWDSDTYSLLRVADAGVVQVLCDTSATAIAANDVLTCTSLGRALKAASGDGYSLKALVDVPVNATPQYAPAQFVPRAIKS